MEIKQIVDRMIEIKSKEKELEDEYSSLQAQL